MRDWSQCKNILCVRADNMGDVLMSSPAIGALKETFGCKITLLTSSKGEEIASLIPGIDHVIKFNCPWVQTTTSVGAAGIMSLVEKIKKHNFDACIVFSVYSQSALPAALVAYLAEIPMRLAYCRENPYDLLTHWLPDKEPYSLIIHQVERDLKLVEFIGARTENEKLSLRLAPDETKVNEKIKNIVNDFPKPYFILHPGVSDEKRKYPPEMWISLGKLVHQAFGFPLLVTGSIDEKALVENMVSHIGEGAHSFAGLLTVEEFAYLIQHAQALVSVNTGTIHIAAALQTPVVVLYAQSNPQHSPWMVRHVRLEFSIPGHLRSRNQVIDFVNSLYYKQEIPFPSPESVLNALRSLVIENK